MSDATESVLRFESIRKVFPPLRSGQAEIVAIDRIDQEVRRGEFIVVVGPSGCGKSTLLEIAAGLQDVTEGRVLLNGHPIDGPDRATGVVFQEESLFPWRTTLDNVLFGLEVRGVPRDERRDRAEEVLELVGLAAFAKSYPRQLSGGMRQRVAIARALATDPDILLMDEPFGALDQQTRYQLGGELLRIWDETRKVVFFVTHDINEAVLLADRVWVLSSRPAVIARELAIDLPRPRGIDTLSLPRFHELTAEVWSVLSKGGSGAERDAVVAAGEPSP